METRLNNILKRFAEIENLIIQPEIISNLSRYGSLMKERGSISKLVEQIKSLEKVQEEIKETQELINQHKDDKDFLALTNEELRSLKEKEKRIQTELEEMLLSDEEEGYRNVIMEIRAGTGGEESALFVSDLFRMYTKYADKKGWKCVMIDSGPTGLGGFKEVIFSVEGDNVYRYLRFESGGHRVQRVPRTEASGRIHTSACTVAVLPEAEEIEVAIKSEDLKIDTYSAGGPGGQHVNKTASAVRITHIPTGTVVACQIERSQHRNRDLAMRLLRTRIHENIASKSKGERDRMRKTQIGSGDRSDKIRTYNFPQNRVTDHRINLSIHNLSVVLEGELDELINKLIEEDRKEKLQNITSNG
ncbi:MAG: peptide chain release factor 1 [Planctomycetota bacterium]|nr:peptide chain release factor 1 [Planctomycetota bacterium]